ncbi:MAG: hypothetical protein IPL12_08455 [Bacteroidetes bacterium]|nr:hypothetical protein [Bacteroidota bacterium]
MLDFSDILAIRSGDAGAKWNKNFTGITENSVYHVIKNFAARENYMRQHQVHMDMYHKARI